MTGVAGRLPPGPMLLRRLMIHCPHTGIPVDTGYETTTVPARGLPHVLVDCMECGQDHTWHIEDAFVERRVEPYARHV